jgi:4'-phosphopantetheinyl transferase
MPRIGRGWCKHIKRFGRRMVEAHPNSACGLATAFEAIREHEVHVWKLDLDSERSRMAVDNVLSDDEAERASAFHFDLHRNRFICCRGSLRTILSGYLHCAPQEVRFEYGQHGKPSVDGLHFNVAHTNGLGLVAVSTSSEVGVDVEAVRWLQDFDELVARFFCPREAQVFARLPNDLKPAAFFNLWTRKEALLKATGEGIAYSLNRVDVTFLPGEPPCVLSTPEEDSWQGWTLKEITPAPGHIGALAIKDASVQVKFKSHELHSG